MRDSESVGINALVARKYKKGYFTCICNAINVLIFSLVARTFSHYPNLFESAILELVDSEIV